MDVYMMFMKPKNFLQKTVDTNNLASLVQFLNSKFICQVAKSFYSSSMIKYQLVKWTFNVAAT